MSLQSSCYPALWKDANVVPLFKKGERSQPGNYRPISLLSCIGKVFERVIFKHIYNYLVDNSLVYTYQSGFLPGHSTVHQLIEIYHNNCLALDKRELSCLIFCDISKAFDRVWHKGLIKKIEGYGIKGNLLSWIVNYLSSRRQRVMVNNICSSYQYISAGVPQGSVLGPLLFLLYINDIADNIESMTRLFADDTSISRTSQSSVELETVINRDLRKLDTWSKNWLVNFNPQKTDAMVISNLAQHNNLHIHFSNNLLEFVDSHKHLGITFSANCKWTVHITVIIASASRQLNMLRKLKFRLDRFILNRLYLTYIRPVLEYASEVWDGCSVTDANRL